MAGTTRTEPPQTEPFPPFEPPPRVTSAQIDTSSVDGSVDSPRNKSHLQRTVPVPGLLEAPHKSDKPGLPAGRTPLTLTGAAAMAELKRKKTQHELEASRQTSPNPAVEAMHTLMGNGGMSKPHEAPAPEKLSEPMRHAADRISMSDATSGDSAQTSPVSAGSFAGNDSTATSSGLTATTTNISSASGQQFVAEPAQMNESSYSSNNHLAPSAQDADGNKAYSYPGPPPDQNQESGPSRGMSLPGYGQTSPKSPASNKRHKCPYCATDFTRHHNLKSHLLTHSQEKPYLCQTCNARFRRLHDLKRHTKLHTGERPHTCDKCGRRFARGDALARHNKGPGGCAGRRSSFGGDDDYVEGAEGMDGVEYGDDEDGEDHSGRRVSEPSRKRAHLESPQDPNRQVYRQHSSTYPPAPNRSMSGTGSMGPPQVIHPGSNNATSPRDTSGQGGSGSGHALNNTYYGTPGQGQVYTQMTESPRPLSPGQPSEQHRLSVPDSQNPSLSRNRSPSLTTQFQQAHFGRGSGRGTPPYTSGHAPNQSAPQLPVLPGMVSTSQAQQGRSALQPAANPTGPGPSMLQHGQVPPTSAHSGGSGQNSLSSHGQSSGGSIRDALGHEQSDIWGYVRSLEQRFSRMQDEYELRISRLSEEVISLRGQVSNAASYSSDMGQPRY